MLLPLWVFQLGMDASIATAPPAAIAGVWTELPRPLVWSEDGVAARGIVYTEPPRGLNWSAPMKVLTKRKAESANYEYDFSASKDPVIVGGDNIASVTSVVATALDPTGAALPTIGAPSFTNTTATAKISGGQDNADYLITFTVVTASGLVRVGLGRLAVQDSQ